MRFAEELAVELRPSLGNSLAVVECFGGLSPFGTGHLNGPAALVSLVGNPVAGIEFIVQQPKICDFS